MAADGGARAGHDHRHRRENLSAARHLVNGSLLRYLDSNDYYFARDPAHPSTNLRSLAVGERETAAAAT